MGFVWGYSCVLSGEDKWLPYARRPVALLNSRSNSRHCRAFAWYSLFSEKNHLYHNLGVKAMSGNQLTWQEDLLGIIGFYRDSDAEADTPLMQALLKFRDRHIPDKWSSETPSNKTNMSGGSGIGLSEMTDPGTNEPNGGWVSHTERPWMNNTREYLKELGKPTHRDKIEPIFKAAQFMQYPTGKVHGLEVVSMLMPLISKIDEIAEAINHLNNEA